MIEPSTNGQADKSQAEAAKELGKIVRSLKLNIEFERKGTVRMVKP